MALFPCNIGSSGGTLIEVGKCIYMSNNATPKVQYRTIPSSSSDMLSMQINGGIIANTEGKNYYKIDRSNEYTPYVYGSNDLHTYTDLSKINVNSIDISEYDYIVSVPRSGSAGNRIWLE